MRVLIACEYSGIVREAFSKRGHDAWSCDLLDTEIPGNHYKGDVRDILYEHWDLMIGHPPCTYLSYAATRVWNEPGRVFKRIEALQFFAELWEAPIDKICLENPKGCASPTIAKYSQVIQPYYWGDDLVKTTWLWLKGLPKLQYLKQDDLFGNKQTMKGIPKSLYYSTGRKKVSTDILGDGFSGTERQKERARFHHGVAVAMAEQWG